jgi:hypothetical protein
MTDNRSGIPGVAVPGKDGKVIQIDFRRLPLKVERKGGCVHRFFAVDERALVVWCRDCGETVDPVRVLLDIARTWTNSSWAARQARHEVERIGKEVDDLKRERKNLRAQISRLKRKEG